MKWCSKIKVNNLTKLAKMFRSFCIFTYILYTAIRSEKTFLNSHVLSNAVVDISRVSYRTICLVKSAVEPECSWPLQRHIRGQRDVWQFILPSDWHRCSYCRRPWLHSLSSCSLNVVQHHKQRIIPTDQTFLCSLTGGCRLDWVLVHCWRLCVWCGHGEVCDAMLTWC